MPKISIKSYGVFIFEVFVLVIVLFGSAGTYQWVQGWAFVIILIVNTVWIVALLNKFDPDLLSERLKFSIQKGQPLWDKVLMILFLSLGLAWAALMGVDAGRFKWFEMPVYLSAIGGIISCAGYYLEYISMRENSFLVPVVKFQEDRGHHVISTGPYAIVRHPFYSVFALTSIGSALLLGSWLGVLTSFLLISLVAYRAVREERFLKTNLEGYDEYISKVPYRFRPYLW